MSDAVQDWEAYVQNVYALRNSKLTTIATIQTNISAVVGEIAAITANPSPTYTITQPTGSQTVDLNGMLNSLNASLNAFTNALTAEMTSLEGLNKLILMFPFQFTTPAR